MTPQKITDLVKAAQAALNELPCGPTKDALVDAILAVGMPEKPLPVAVGIVFEEE